MTPFELENEEGLRLRGLDFGATLTSLTLPVAGSRREVLLGCADEAYPAQQVWLGAVAGRLPTVSAGQSWCVMASTGLWMPISRLTACTVDGRGFITGSGRSRNRSRIGSNSSCCQRQGIRAFPATCG